MNCLVNVFYKNSRLGCSSLSSYSVKYFAKEHIPKVIIINRPNDRQNYKHAFDQMLLSTILFSFYWFLEELLEKYNKLGGSVYANGYIGK